MFFLLRAENRIEVKAVGLMARRRYFVKQGNLLSPTLHKCVRHLRPGLAPRVFYLFIYFFSSSQDNNGFFHSRCIVSISFLELKYLLRQFIELIYKMFEIYFVK